MILAVAAAPPNALTWITFAGTVMAMTVVIVILTRLFGVIGLFLGVIWCIVGALIMSSIT